MKLFFLIAVFFSVSNVFAYTTESITVDRCEMDVIVMQTAQEHATGMLGYNKLTFTHDGMLFDMKSNKRKYFHTEGMQMPIRIMGVTKLPNGNYKVVTEIYYAPPGRSSIPINAPDVLEIPENKYQLKYKNCLLTKEKSL